MPRPSIFHIPVIRFIHAKAGPFSLREVRDAVGIKDPKTIRIIIRRLEALGYVAYAPINSPNKRWFPTDKWNTSANEPQAVLDDYVTIQILRRSI